MLDSPAGGGRLQVWSQPMLPPSAGDWHGDCARRLMTALSGAYFVGSIALGGYVANESDVGHRRPVRARCPRLLVVGAVLECTRACPARGLEFTLYRKVGGPRMPGQPISMREPSRFGRDAGAIALRLHKPSEVATGPELDLDNSA